MGDGHEVADHLLDERTVHAARDPDRLDGLGGGVPAGQGPRRIGRGDVRQEERERADRQEHDDAPQQPADHVSRTSPLVR